ncbi:hypothetical protein D3C85_1534950 [compost metagenome]
MVDGIAAQRLLHVIAANLLVFTVAQPRADHIAELTLAELVQNRLQATLLLNPLHNGDVINALTVGTAQNVAQYAIKQTHGIPLPIVGSANRPQ